MAGYRVNFTFTVFLALISYSARYEWMDAESVSYFCPILTEPEYGRHMYNKNPPIYRFTKVRPMEAEYSKEVLIYRLMLVITFLPCGAAARGGPWPPHL